MRGAASRRYLHQHGRAALANRSAQRREQHRFGRSPEGATLKPVRHSLADHTKIGRRPVKRHFGYTGYKVGLALERCSCQYRLAFCAGFARPRYQAKIITAVRFPRVLLSAAALSRLRFWRCTFRTRLWPARCYKAFMVRSALLSG